ncbi:hypothetical protein ABT297_22655 [Dactylosporangium sp. NPDC000555]|uniref:hypothetical protein n=1 Tax=Dactylosporangium sp. NPDC000555 TaxID=3154260 RepID=UPI00331CF5CF
MPDAVTGWLDSLADLEGVPFNYLVPDAAQAAGESLRFFSVAEGWMAALLDGALSLGRVTPQTCAWTPRSPRTWPRTRGRGPRTCCIRARRSAAAGSCCAPTPWPAGRTCASPRRTARCQSARCCCRPTPSWSGIRITQPPQTLHFTLGDDAAAWQGGNRVVDVAALASATFAASMLAGATTIAVARG